VQIIPQPVPPPIRVFKTRHHCVAGKSNPASQIKKFAGRSDTLLRENSQNRNMEVSPFPIVVRPPRPSEKLACRMILPHSAGPGRECHFLIAATGQPERVIAAAALTWDTALQDLKGWEVDVHVLPPFRRHGIARKLIDAICNEANIRRIPAVHPREWVKLDSEAFQFWTSLGFSETQRKFEYTGASADFLAALKQIYDLTQEHGKIPPNARVVTLAEADIEPIVRLHLQHLGGSASVLRPLLAGTHPNPYDRQLSLVLMLDDQVVGFVLGRILPEISTYQLESTVIAPTVRRSWANILLRYEVAVRGTAMGLKGVQYIALDQHADTRRAGARLNARLTQILMRMRRQTCPISPAAESAGRQPDPDGGDPFAAEA
jgi:GNAT superfamily N-acetyltransferase